MTQDIEATARRQMDLYGQISRAYENLKKTGAANITLGLAEARLQSLESKWTKFETQHESLLSAPAEELAALDYIKQDVPALAEEAFLLQKGIILDLIRSLKPKETGGTVAENGPASNAAPRTTLPRIQLPHFSGKYEDWPAFRDLFSSIVGRDHATSLVEKLHYLKSCLKGEAELLIRNLPTTGDNYEKAWSILSNYYENKRLLVRAYLSNFVALSKLKSESAAELRRILHCIKATASSLESIGRPISSSEDLFVFLSVELLDPRSRREWERDISDSTEPASFAILEQFLERRLHTLESMLPGQTESSSSKSGSAATKSAARSHVARKQDAKSAKKGGRCALCAGDHFVLFCEGYQGKTAQDRKQAVTENHLCLNCLGRHKVSECTTKKSCSACGARHHSSVHDACREIDSAPTTHITRNVPAEPANVLLATARIRVEDSAGDWQQARALVDQGSETTIVSERLTQRLRLSRSSAAVTIFGVGGAKSAVARGRVKITLAPRTGGPSLTVNALVLPRLTVYSSGPKGADSRRTWPHIKDLELADPNFDAADKIDILLGADVYAIIIRQGLRKGSPREPIAQETTLGWILSGTIKERFSGHVTRTLQCRVEDELTSLVKRLWEQDEVPPTGGTLSEDERQCEAFFEKAHFRQPDGRYVVRLPLVAPLPDFSDTRRAAMRTLSGMEARFKRNPAFHQHYAEFMRLYEAMGHMTRVPSAEDISKACYLPHHGVMRESSSTTKLRVVFNGSCKISTGETLNKHLLAGANLLSPLDDIILRWRRHRYVMATDVEKMYRQINVHPQDRDLQRILWRENQSQEVKEFRLNTVTYGLACAPFLAIRTLRQLSRDEEDKWPLGSAALRQNVYMDDILVGAASIEEAEEIQRQLIAICKAGGFPLKKWSANDASLLEKLPTEDRLQQETRWWQPEESHLTLGLRWHPCEDQFSFSIPTFQLEIVTKRTVLSLAARLFDPLGWLAPTTIRAKIWIQSTWLLGLDWDDRLPEADELRWQNYKADLINLKTLRVSRWLSWQADCRKVTLHGFADASERAYAAAVYLRTEDKTGKVEVCLVSAKTKVAPIKQVTLPRLELCAAALLARLAARVRSTLNIVEAPHLWSDSTVVLGWISGHPSSWKTYVANRVSEIQTTVPDAIWHHVSGSDNPADCASRGVSPGDLVSHPLWWHGPPWLRAPGFSVASRDRCAEEHLPERRLAIHLASPATADINEPELLFKYSTLQRLLRITAWCMRWRRCQQSRVTAATNITEEGQSPILQAFELEDARTRWLQIIQGVHFKEEREAIGKDKILAARNPMGKLSPFLDPQGLLRVGGRLKHSLLPYDKKHPIILPGRSQLAKLVIADYHTKTMHGGVQLTLGAIRQEYWIPGGRSLVKSYIHRCHTCVRWRAASPQPPMGDLPAPRVTPSRPFLVTGVDCAGPVWLRTSKGRGHHACKAFITVFVCFSSKAVHLDVVSDYSADAFLAALRRFVARRGLCRVLYSDCGTNFTGADSKLRALFSVRHREGKAIASHLTDEGIQWRFNPPAAPNFGGLWEAAVKSTKHHLRRVIGDTKLTFEEMSTLLAQIEACLNSRPLQALTDDPEDLTALTPGHFLVGSALTAIPEPTLADETASRLSRWQLIQQMRDHFWDRWSKEYLHTLAHRPKWTKVEETVDVGRLCLIRNEAAPPTKWPLARIESLHPGKDGHVRVVSVRTSTSTFTRPVSKLVLLPIDTEK